MSQADPTDELKLLIPRPYRVWRIEGHWRPGDRVILSGGGPTANLEPANRWLENSLTAFGLEVERAHYHPEGDPLAGSIRLALEQPGSSPTQSYRLRVAPGGVDISASDPAGLFYGACTLAQWVGIHAVSAGSPLAVPALAADDRPDLLARGVLLDISRDKVPSMPTLFGLVDLLAGLKINQLQLYTEHTFAYRDHAVVWKRASPMTAEEIRALDAYCRERMVELVANQNSFGHLHRWLVHEPYRRLAECPEGIQHGFSEEREPFSLCAVDPKSLEFLGGLYDELLPNFSSGQVNVGLDETFDLGQGRSKDHCRRRGKGRVYLDFLLEIHSLLATRGRKMQFWGDIVLKHPELIEELPKDVTPLAWGYEADHPFASQVVEFAKSGLQFYVCPGTSSWNSLGGRSRNALLNLAGAASAAKKGGASGYLITDWGDHGHLQPLPVSYLGYLAGAGFSWNASSADDPLSLPIAELIDLHVFGEQELGLGRVLLELGDVHGATGVESFNGGVLFYLLIFASDTLGSPRFEALDAQGLSQAKAKLDELRHRLETIARRPHAVDLEIRELLWVVDMLGLACRLGTERLSGGRDRPLADLPASARGPMHRDLERLLAEHQEIWLERNRSGGLEESTRALLRLADMLA